MPIREALFLVSNGVPFDVAFSLDDMTRLAWVVILKESQDPVKFNFTTMQFEEAKK